MEPEIEISIEGPVVYVYDDEQTYSSLYNERESLLDVTTRVDRKSPLERLISDLVGGAFIYFGTFILCDLIRTFREGTWTPLYWSIWGPYRYLTGAPILTRIIKRMDKETCQDKYEDYLDDCEGRGFDPPLINILNHIKEWNVGDLTESECENVGQIRLIHCQNKGMQGDTKEMMCQRQADNELIQYIQEPHSVLYSVQVITDQWLKTYNECLDSSIDPPDGSISQTQKCLDANDNWVQGCYQLSFTPGECDYIYENNKKACKGDYDEIYGCSNLYEDLAQCYQTSNEPGIFCQNLTDEVTDCERYQYNFNDPNVNRVY